MPKRLRESGDAASKGCMDIRSALARGARPTVHTLNAAQTDALAHWSLCGIGAAVAAWAPMDTDACALLFLANVRLIPESVAAAFHLNLCCEDSAMAEVRATLSLARAWWELQAAALQEIEASMNGHAASET